MANIYVRKSGNDSNDGSTPALAKLTIAGAISAMTSGDTIYVGSGIYREQSINGGSKHITIIGDITGEYTGDAGEVIWSGLNSTDDGYISLIGPIITNGSSYNLSIYNIIFQNFKINEGTWVIYKNSSSANFTIENCSFKNIFTYSNGIKPFGLIYFTTYSSSIISIKNINIDNIAVHSTAITQVKLFYISSSYSSSTVKNLYVKNIKAKNIFVANVSASDSYIYGFIFENSSLSEIENIDIDNFFLCANSTSGTSELYGIHFGMTRATNINNCSVTNLSLLSNSSSSSRTCIGVRADSNSYLNNCNVFNTINNTISGTNYSASNKSNCIEKANYVILKNEPISKYSPLRGLGYTTFPSTDIDGNPRPAYGNGTACDIGASESTSSIVQKESTVKDSGDFSMKVAPCNYFKKVFQIPVTASTLRTVKVKIRIDGTWGTYRPKVTLNGQGMTASTATKNTTTGSFEELTVSGTPTTTGIALLTIEAHSPNTDAAFYIDTITIE